MGVQTLHPISPSQLSPLLNFHWIRPMAPRGAVPTTWWERRDGRPAFCGLGFSRCHQPSPPKKATAFLDCIKHVFYASPEMVYGIGFRGFPHYRSLDFEICRWFSDGWICIFFARNTHERLRFVAQRRQSSSHKDLHKDQGILSFPWPELGWLCTWPHG